MLSSGTRRQSMRIGAARWFSAIVVACSSTAYADTVAVVPVRMKPPQGIERGTLVTYTDALGREWCTTVVELVEGPGSDVWAWVRFNADPRRTAHGPVHEFKRGCPP